MLDAHATRRLARFGWALLVYTLFVIAFGAWVRITGSGAGCGQHWPTCHGEIVPRAPSAQTLIEFTHRLTSGVYGILVLALLLWAIVRFPRWHLVRIGAWAALVFTIAEALLGAGLVKMGLVADDDSVARAFVIALHLVNTSFLTGALALTCWAAGDPNARARLSLAGKRRTAAVLFGALIGLAVVGMSGAITALGDTLFPVRDAAASLGDRLSADHGGGAHFLQRLRVLHPLLAIGIGGLLLVVTEHLAGRLDGSRDVARFGRWVAIGVLVQVAAGGINIYLSAPGWMQIVHLLLGSLLWIALVLFTASALATDR